MEEIISHGGPAVAGHILFTMAINIVSSLDSGKIASLLEVFAIFTGLLIAANLQAIVSLAARRRLYCRGTARLSDSTWNLGVLQGVTNPRRLLRDFRACLAFMTALVVICLCLEVLTVLQTRSSRSCAFGESSTWKIQKSLQKCFSSGASANPEILASNNVAMSYINSAKDTAKDVDLNVGIPVDTDVYEDSIISGKAVRQLMEGNYTERYNVVESFDITGNVSVRNGKPFTPITVFSGKDEYTHYSEMSCALNGKEKGETHSWFPTNPEYGHFDKNRSLAVTAAKGYLYIQPCLNNVVFRICEYTGGRQEFPATDLWAGPSFKKAGDGKRIGGELDGKRSEGNGNGSSSESPGNRTSFKGEGGGKTSGGVGNGSSSESAGDENVFIASDGETVSIPSFLHQTIDIPEDGQSFEGAGLSHEVQCKIHVISREGRKTDSGSIFVALFGAETFDTSTIRRAVLVSLIGQNSASKVKCRRSIAASKECTQIGWISLGAVLLLIGIFVLTFFARLWLKIASHNSGNFNGSPQRLAEALFKHFEGPDRNTFDVSRKRKKRELLLALVPRPHEEDIHMSVLEGVSKPGSYRLMWTRGPLPEGVTPAVHIPSKEIILRAENVEDDEEISLV